MPNYKNISPSAKTITIKGNRVFLQPNAEFYSEEDLDLNIFFYLTKTKNENKSSNKIEIKEDNNLKEYIESKFNENKSSIEIINKRMEILKKAVVSIQQMSEKNEEEIKNIKKEIYENGGMIIHDDLNEGK
jgi:hypothetical protein